jgi:uncharacterized cupredoxin-like copper-binding protein
MMKMTTMALSIGLLLSSSVGFAAQTNSQTVNNAAMEMTTEEHANMDMSKMDHTTMPMDNMSMGEMNDVGMAAKGAKPTKVIHVILSDDMKISFKKEVTIAPNDVVQFVIMNMGKIEHEFAIGSEREQLAHRDMMKTMTNHAHHSDSAVTVEPGKAAQLTWHFHGDNNIVFACNIPGHSEAGMIKKITL